MDEDRGIQAVVGIYVQSGQLSKAQADLAVASSLSVVGAREQLNAAVRELMYADTIRGIQAAVDSFVQSGKLPKAEAGLAVASSLTVAGALLKLNTAANKLKQADEKKRKDAQKKAEKDEHTAAGRHENTAMEEANKSERVLKEASNALEKAADW
jgi:hypothetical protein